jgi:KDO2-lipid IV(A) lauroyltransferase
LSADFTAGALRVAAALFQALPERRAVSLGRGLGFCCHAMLRGRRRAALAGMRRAFGRDVDPQALARLCRDNFAHYGVVLAEFLRLPRLSEEQLVARFTVQGLAHATAARARGRGLIIRTAHLGHREYLAQAQAAWNLDMLVITRRAHQRGVDRFWQGIRRARRSRFVDAHGSLGAVMRHLRRGGTVGMSIDQHEGGTTAVRVPFFGEEAGTVKAPALLALRTGAPVILLLSWRDAGGTHHATFSEEIPLAAGGDPATIVAGTTRRYNERLEAAIREHPEQWAWVHRRWKPA